MRYRILTFCLVLCFVVFFVLLNRPSEKVQRTNSLAGMVESTGNFSKAEGIIHFSFPLDHGPHSHFQTEWWYYTGNLKTVDGRPFGYQLTFFRRALSDQTEIRTSTWAANQVYMAHFALTDPTGQKFTFLEKLERGVPELAGAQGQPAYAVWLHDWEVRQTGTDAYHLKANQDGISIDLDLIDSKGPILQGDQGYSRKGKESGNASYYYSQTRLKTIGVINIGITEFPVSGLSWMDHEFSTSALGAGVVGWDWFSIQLDDETEIMLFTLRKEDGSLDEYSSGTIIKKDGSTRQLNVSEFVIEPLEFWQSPASGARYPSGWLVAIPSEEVRLTVHPVLKNQELTGFFTYWEGSAKVSGNKKGNPVNGSGYVELTGYASSMQGQF